METKNITTQTFDLENKEMCNAYDLIAKTNNSFFLTGRAGTGKTTFLQKVQECVNKNFVVLAPSGVAAIHAGGQTIHSFFGLGLGVQGPRDMGTMNASKISLVQKIDTIIIDEVSMVRCDIIDAIDRMLRYYRHSFQPFGGVQMVFVGDLFQLLPIAAAEDQLLLRSIYGSNCWFFYKARCLENNALPKIEFQKIYRQSDPTFISLLEHFRTGHVNLDDLKRINGCVVPPFTKRDEQEMRITLTAYRGDARIINESRLADLPGEQFSYEASYEGNASKLKDVVDDKLILKEGAQVMFLRNDQFGRWANGTLAKVVSLDKSGITVALEGDEERQVSVEQQTWEAYDYEYDEKEKVCKKKVVGSVTQFPLRLAWAITIHKSQSLTFDKVAVDFGRGAFTYGQVYVALSRARSLEGLTLVNPIDFSSVRVSHDVQVFAASYNDESVIATELAVGEAVQEFERLRDHDGAASKLFAMCNDEAHNGDPHRAFELLNRALSYVADDACFFGTDWELIPNRNRECILLNAAGLIYSGKAAESIRLLTTVVSATDDNFNGLYLLARALEECQDWDTVEILYNQMISLFEKATDNGTDSPAYRKFRYRLAILNEGHYGDPGFHIIKDLIAENPYYDRYHADLRWMLQKHKEELGYELDEDNPLINLLMDEGVSEEDFLKALREERSGKTDAWHHYRRYISRLRPIVDQEAEKNS